MGNSNSRVVLIYTEEPSPLQFMEDMRRCQDVDVISIKFKDNTIMTKEWYIRGVLIKELMRILLFKRIKREESNGKENK